MRRAFQRALGRRRRVLVAGALTAAAGLAVGVAGSVGYALATGYDRAAARSDQPDLLARFAPQRLSALDTRLRSLPNVRRISYRLEVNSVRLSAKNRTRANGAVHVVRPGRRGYAIVAGRDLGTGPGEVLVERGVAREWHLAPGDRIDVGSLGALRIVGVALSVDNVAFPLAGVPRVYVSQAEIDRDFGADPDPGANLALVWLADPSRLDITLAAARPAAFGLRTEQLLTRRGVQQVIGQAAGIVIALLAVFGLVASGCAGAMLAAAAGADVRRRAPLLGLQRALGATRAGVVGEQILDAILVAAPAAALGLGAGALVAAAPDDALLGYLNEVGPGVALLGPLALAFTGLVTVVVAGAAWPAWQLNRRPVAALLRGGDLAAPRGLRRRRALRRAGEGARPVLLGARFVVARRGRWLAGVGMLAVAVAAVLLILSVAGLLVSLRDDPGTLGRRYALTVPGNAGDAATISRIPGVAAAAQRTSIEAADSFSLTQPLRVIAYPGDHVPFEAPPLSAGRRLRSDREAEVGLGLADALGLRPGSELAIQTATGRELRFRVAGVVRALENDGRVVYTRTAPLRRDDPSVGGPIAVRLAPGADRSDVVRRLESAGFSSTRAGAATLRSTSFLGVLATVLRIVAFAIGLVCLAAVLQTLGLTARDRRRSLAVMRACGATPGTLAAVLAGSAAALILPALVAAVVLQRFVLGPLVAGLTASYVTLPLGVAASDVLVVGGGLAVMGVIGTLVATATTTREPVAGGLEDRD